MSSRLRDQHLEYLCDALGEVAPTAPTLCEGWDAHDLAVHIWVIKRDPLSWPGVVVPVFGGATRRRAERFRQRWSYESLVATLRQGSGAIAPMPFDRFEGHRHALGEYYIHTEDVVRANDLPRRTQTTETEGAMWLRARTAGRQLWGRGGEAVGFESPDREPFTIGRGVPKNA